jgi:hypothetical protein
MWDSLCPYESLLTAPASIPVPPLGSLHHAVRRHRRPTPRSPDRLNCVKDAQFIKRHDSPTMHAAPPGSVTPQISSRLQHLHLSNSPAQTQIRLSLHRYFQAGSSREQPRIRQGDTSVLSTPRFQIGVGKSVTIRFRRAMLTDSVRAAD